MAVIIDISHWEMSVQLQIIHIDKIQGWSLKAAEFIAIIDFRVAYHVGINYNVSELQTSENLPNLLDVEVNVLHITVKLLSWIRRSTKHNKDNYQTQNALQPEKAVTWGKA